MLSGPWPWRSLSQPPWPATPGPRLPRRRRRSRRRRRREAQAAEDLSRPMGPPDPFNRGTPRGSMYGFLSATREGDYERAANFLDLRRLPPEQRDSAPELARRLKAVLDQTLWVDVVNLSKTNEGQLGRRSSRLAGPLRRDQDEGGLHHPSDAARAPRGRWGAHLEGREFDRSDRARALRRVRAGVARRVAPGLLLRDSGISRWRSGSGSASQSS